MCIRDSRVLDGGLTDGRPALPFMLKLGLLRRPRWRWEHEGVKRIGRLMLPAIFGSSVSQVALLLDTLIAALEHGLVPETVRIDQPITIDGWSPQNYSEQYLGPVSLQRALALSLNTISVQLTQEVGAASVVSTARRLGLTTPLEPNPSIALGTSEVSVLEMTGAFAPFANGGNGVLPYVIRRITTSDGDIVYQRTGGGPGPVVDIRYVGMMNSMMRETLQSGTGRGAVIDGWDAAGKTGTSQDYRDAWFIGYTSELVAGVWVGNDDNSPTKQVTGGLIPAEIWRDVMVPAHAGLIARALPGGQNQTEAAPTTIARVDKQDALTPDAEDEPRMQNNGFFEDIGSLFRSGGSNSPLSWTTV